ncbi:MAG: mercuric transporter MerT family protein [Roseateles sp.]|uniref:mercuric transporter MerT family protein n=1 Tax=Roseateles sp. TaxID=1971397 RepID=UPI0039EBA448
MMGAASTPARTASGSLALAGLTALLASSCCVLPLALALLGVSGAWMSRLRVLEPYSAALIALSFAALALAAWRLFRPAAACAPDGACRAAQPAARRWFWLVALLALLPLAVPLLAPFFY